MTAHRLARVTFGLALAGVAIASYLTIAHFTSPNVLACSGSGFVDCATVTTSVQSTFVGIPVAVIGLGWFVAMAALCSPAAWEGRFRSIGLARFALSLLGMGFVLWLIYAELFIIRALCIWCTVIHVLTFSLFALIALYGKAVEPDA